MLTSMIWRLVNLFLGNMIHQVYICLSGLLLQVLSGHHMYHLSGHQSFPNNSLEEPRWCYLNAFDSVHNAQVRKLPDRLPASSVHD